ncbi:MAG: hypothetical protein RMI91_06205 [Gemmatales bacterium]|nr:hypothetical protein [Gemmatales bacterium]MDW7994228.1 hypothetical protein [Gemmatales bacterium]
MEDFAIPTQAAYVALPAWLLLLALTARLLWHWRSSALAHALVWGMWAVAANALIWLVIALRYEVPLSLRYSGLVFAGCACTAVLGARFPGARPWHFVVASFAVLAMLPVFQQPWRSPEWRPDAMWCLLLAIVLAVGWINYLPTRAGWVVSGLAWTALWQLALLAREAPSKTFSWWADWWSVFGLWWAGFFSVLLWRSSKASPALQVGSAAHRDWELVQRLWRELRDGWGVVWAWRVWEMLQNAARHMGLPGEFTWTGLRLSWNSLPESVIAHHKQSGAATDEQASVPAELPRYANWVRLWLSLLAALARRFAPPCYPQVISQLELDEARSARTTPTDSDDGSRNRNSFGDEAAPA